MDLRVIFDKYENLMSQPDCTDEQREHLGDLAMLEILQGIAKIYEGEPKDYKSSKTKNI